MGSAWVREAGLVPHAQTEWANDRSPDSGRVQSRYCWLAASGVVASLNLAREPVTFRTWAAGMSRLRSVDVIDPNIKLYPRLAACIWERLRSLARSSAER